jgi:hypothetical protein
LKDEVKMIPIDRIRILNPRHRDRKKFEIIVQSIKNLGLKKPIQVSLRSAQEEEGAGYDLVCIVLPENWTGGLDGESEETRTPSGEIYETTT